MTNRAPLEWLWIVLIASGLATETAEGFEPSQPEVTLGVALPSSAALLICGGGDISEEVMQHFIELAGGSNAKIVHVPTAARGADRDESDADFEYFRQQKLGSLTVFHTRSHELANDPLFARPLNEATGVWLGGGSQDLLADAYLGTATHDLIRQVLERGGIVGGISAGAAVMSSVMIRGGELEPVIGPGFNLLPGTIVDQHFIKRNRQGRLLRALARHPELVGIGIDEYAALLVRGNRLTVMGDSDVVTCLYTGDDASAEIQRLRPGDEANLQVLIQTARQRLQARKPAMPIAAQEQLAMGGQRLQAPQIAASRPLGDVGQRPVATLRPAHSASQPPRAFVPSADGPRKSAPAAYSRQAGSPRQVQIARSPRQSPQPRPSSAPHRRRIAWAMPAMAR